MKFFLSIILTTHNRPNLLSRAIQSLRKQSFSNFEIILCADESEEKTKIIAQKMLMSQDTFLSNPNLKGPADTRNIGLNLARGDWICFLDDDDTFDCDFFEKSLDKITNHEKVYFFNYSKVFEDRTNEDIVQLSVEDVHMNSPNTDHLLVQNFIPNNTLFVPKYMAKNFEFDRNLSSHEDWDWILSLKYNNVSFEHVPLLGPKIHISNIESRNNFNNKQIDLSLDYLYIYRKWPSNQEHLKQERCKVLQNFGITVPSEYL